MLGLSGNFVQTVSATLSSQIASSAISDLFNISGNAAIGGTLALSCIISCAISIGDSFVLLNSGSSLSGVSRNVATSSFLNGFSYDLIYDYTNRQVRLSILDAGMVTPPPPVGAVREPSTWGMILLGFGFIGGAMLRPNAGKHFPSLMPDWFFILCGKQRQWARDRRRLALEQLGVLPPSSEPSRNTRGFQ